MREMPVYHDNGGLVVLALVSVVYSVLRLSCSKMTKE